jgi:hypothetical protein
VSRLSYYDLRFSVHHKRGFENGLMSFDRLRMTNNGSIFIL